MKDNIDLAKDHLKKAIPGHYSNYISKRLAGDFAAAVSDYIKKLQTKLDNCEDEIREIISD